MMIIITIPTIRKTRVITTPTIAKESDNSDKSDKSDNSDNSDKSDKSDESDSSDDNYIHYEQYASMTLAVDKDKDEDEDEYWEESCEKLHCKQCDKVILYIHNEEKLCEYCFNNRNNQLYCSQCNVMISECYCDHYA